MKPSIHVNCWSNDRNCWTTLSGCVRRMIASKYRMTLSGCMQRMIASRYRMTCHCVKMKHVVLCHCPAWNKPCCNSETKHTGYAAQQRCCCLAMWQLTQSLYPVIRLSGENINFRAQELEKAGSPSLCLWPSHNFSCTISIKSHTHKKILPWSYYSAHKALLPLWINCFLLVISQGMHIFIDNTRNTTQFCAFFSISVQNTFNCPVYFSSVPFYAVPLRFLHCIGYGCAIYSRRGSKDQKLKLNTERGLKFLERVQWAVSG